MMIFENGQQVIWHYTPHVRRSRHYLVAAEIVQYGPRRTRIRVHTDRGETALRWVNPKNLRRKEPDEPVYPYPKLN
jgi:hypothetical protein